MDWDQIVIVDFLRNLAEEYHAKTILVTREVFDRLAVRVQPAQINYTPGHPPTIWITPYTEVTMSVSEEPKAVIDLTGEEIEVRE